MPESKPLTDAEIDEIEALRRERGLRPMTRVFAQAKEANALRTRAQSIPQEVKRYDVEPFSGKVALCQGGEFVLYTDYAALQSQPTQAQYAALIEVARAATFLINYEGCKTRLERDAPDMAALKADKNWTGEKLFEALADLKALGVEV